jgi:hypothetical protein
VLNKDDIRVAHFGSNPHTEIRATYEFDKQLQNSNNQARWHSIAVIEQLSFLHKDLEWGMDGQMQPHNTKLWGSGFLLEDQDPFYKAFYANSVKYGYDQDSKIRNFFMCEIEKHARYIVPFIKNIT